MMTGWAAGASPLRFVKRTTALDWQLGILNLILAIVWLTSGLAVLALDYFGNGTGRTLLGTRLSLGWALLAMALYNLLRWWRLHAYQARFKEQQPLRPQRRRPSPLSSRNIPSDTTPPD